jgi:hypothetical protein
VISHWQASESALYPSPLAMIWARAARETEMTARDSDRHGDSDRDRRTVGRLPGPMKLKLEPEKMFAWRRPALQVG